MILCMVDLVMILDGGSGSDSVDYSYVNDAYDDGDVKEIQANLDGDTYIKDNNDDDLEHDTMSSIENYTGFDGKDIVLGNSANNTIYGKDGDDTISSGTGDDYLYGGDGDDTFNLTDNGKNRVYGGEFSGDSGKDIVNYKDSGTAITVSWDEDNSRYKAVHTTEDELNGIEVIRGTNLADEFEASDNNDSYYGGAGNDVLRGGAGEDYLNGEDGIDTIYDDTGSDTLIGGGQDGDRLDFSNITDRKIEIDLTVGSALEVDSNDDSVSNSVDGFNVVVTTAQDDTLKGSSNKDTLYAGDGNDTIIATVGGDELHGEEGSEDWLSFEDITSGVVASIKDGNASGGAGNMTFDGIENLKGTDDIDELTGDSASNSILGLDGDDSLNGLAGDDTLLGGDGNDTIFEGDGTDYIDGGNGSNDWLSYEGVDTGENGIEIDLSQNKVIKDGFGTDGSNNEDVNEEIYNIENIFATNNSDLITANDQINSIKGEDGADEIHAGGEADKVWGGLKADLIYGDDGDDKLYGESDNDTIYGGDGSDTIDGGAGNDKLYGKLDEDDDNRYYLRRSGYRYRLRKRW